MLNICILVCCVLN